MMQRAERRHEHEIEDDRELQEREQRDQERLVARKAALAFLLVVDRRSERLFGHDT